MDKTSLIELFEKEGQSQVLRFAKELSEKEKEVLFSEMEKVDFAMIHEAMSTGQNQRETKELSEGSSKEHDREDPILIEPLSTMKAGEILKQRERFAEAGRKILREGKAAALILAGGQGSRLGFEGPKGTYPLRFENGRNAFIFELLLENLRRNLAGDDPFPDVYIMTSRDNHKDTVRFFEEHEYFSYPQSSVCFFEQGLSPALSEEGKILLESPGHLSLAPNGNGGWFRSLIQAGLSERMKQRGIEWINVVSVDNILQNILDPVFLGAAALSGEGAAAKVIAKVSPEERVGAICLKNGRPSVVEYSELTDSMREAKNEEGEYLYHFGVTLNYLFKWDEIEKRAGERLPVHSARKKVPHLSEDGTAVEKDGPFCIKMEYFIFDILEAFDSALSFEVIREDEFAPIKNREGADSPESAKRLYEAKYSGGKAV